MIIFAAMPNFRMEKYQKKQGKEWYKLNVCSNLRVSKHLSTDFKYQQYAKKRKLTRSLSMENVDNDLQKKT
jgi:hypothetical protein